MLDKKLQKEDFWGEAWIRHIKEYLKATPRAGIFIKNYFKSSKKILEIAGGSCRDSRYLANSGFDATGSDFDEKTLDYLQQQKFPNDILKYSKEDAFSLSFEANSFDLIFHNGFFVLFNDEHIINMLNEQERVSNRFIVILVHNRENKKLVEIFQEKSKDDDLYKIRFFDKDEMVKIVEKSGIKYKKIDVLKFGGSFDAFYKKIVKRVIPNILYPWREQIIPKLYQFQKWEDTERICCIIELDR